MPKHTGGRSCKCIQCNMRRKGVKPGRRVKRTTARGTRRLSTLSLENRANRRALLAQLRADAAPRSNPFTQFRDMPIGARFEFDHSGLPIGSGIARGPWVKTSVTKYRHVDGGPEHRVGTSKVKVVVLNPSVTVFRNPSRTRVKRNPVASRVAQVLSRRAFDLSYNHSEDGKAYRHKFAPGVHIQLLRDGSVRLYRPDGKPIWKRFED